MLIKLYKTLARPLLDYASFICCLLHVYLIDFIKTVQRRFAKYCLIYTIAAL